jgi:hypothetical protein
MFSGNPTYTKGTGTQEHMERKGTGKRRREKRTGGQRQRNG